MKKKKKKHAPLQDSVRGYRDFCSHVFEHFLVVDQFEFRHFIATTLFRVVIRQYSRMTVKLQELAIKANLGLLWYLQTVAIVKSEVMVAVRYKNSKK